MKPVVYAMLFWPAVAFVGGVFAAPVTSEQAEKAVGNWLARGRSLDRTLGASVESSQALSATNGAVFHVVRLNRGYVVTSGDTKLEPVIAYSTGSTFDVSEANPFYALVRQDAAVRAAAAGLVADGTPAQPGPALRMAAPSEPTDEERKWAELLDEDDEPQTPGTARVVNMALPSVPDVRVAPLVKSTWGQDRVGSKNVYNRFTPNNYVCGCVATVGAQIMRYFEWPKSSMAQYTCSYCEVDKVPQTLITQAGVYDWANMPLSPTSAITDTEREAIGKLTSDIGICCGMSYKSNGSGTGGYMLTRAFKENFGYSNAIAMQKSDQSCTAEETKNALVSNFDAGLPVSVSLAVGNTGHNVVGDGYGYSEGTLYYHFNMGWSGSEDVWYAPPSLETSRYAFNILDGFVYNIYTNGMENAVICSGRVLTADGEPVAGATVEARQSNSTVQSKITNDKGIYAFILPAGSYSVIASKAGGSSSRSVMLSACVDLSLCTGDKFGSYYSLPTPSVGNRCDQDIVLNGLASVAEPLFSPGSCLFYPSTNVTLTCSTEGAVIRYTMDGSDPTETSIVYGGSIFVDDDVTIKARAFKDGLNPSAVAVAVFTYDAAQGAPKGDYFDNPISISGATGSRTINNICDYSLEDGEQRHTRVKTQTGYSSSYEYQSAWFLWTAPGSGTMTFTTRCVGGYRYPTAVAVYEGDAISSIERLAMSKDYQSSGDYSTSVSCAVEQGKTYRIVGVTLYDLTNVNGSMDTSASFSLAWSGELVVAAAETPVMEGVPIPVKYDWLAEHYPSASVSDYENLVKTTGANGRAVWESYLLGLDPMNPASDFRITSFVLQNGTPVIEYNVSDSRVDGFGYECRVKGSANPDGGPWSEPVPSHRFFKVVVEPK